MKPFKNIAARWSPDWIWYALVAWLLLHAVAGCGQREARYATGEVRAAGEIKAALPGVALDKSYAIVRSDALPALFDNYQSGLFHFGLTKADAQLFDCNHCAGLYVSANQICFAAAAWHSTQQAQNLALAIVAYHRTAQQDNHVIVAAVTERGLIFIEPQNGTEITLTATERASIYSSTW